MIHHLHVDREQTDASPGQIKSRMWYERGYSASTSTLRRSFLTPVGDARSCGSFESEAHVSRLYHFYNAREVLMLEEPQTSSKMLYRCRKENRDTSTGFLRPHKSAASVGHMRSYYKYPDEFFPYNYLVCEPNNNRVLILIMKTKISSGTDSDLARQCKARPTRPSRWPVDMIHTQQLSVPREGFTRCVK